MNASFDRRSAKVLRDKLVQNWKQKHVLPGGTRGKIFVRLASAGKHTTGGKRGKMCNRWRVNLAPDWPKERFLFRLVAFWLFFLETHLIYATQNKVC